jgi:hypothetical protein
MIRSNTLTLTLAVAGVVTLAGVVQAAPVIVASQDHTLRRGPSIESNIHIKQSTNNSTDRVGMIRFDSADFGANVTDVAFLLTATTSTNAYDGSYVFRVWGVNESSSYDELFVEGGYVPGTGNLSDGSDNLIDESILTQLGDSATISVGETINLNTPELLAFVQGDTNGTVTLVVERLTLGNNSVFLDRTSGSPPRLDITVIPEPASLVMGLFGMTLIAVRRRR